MPTCPCGCSRTTTRLFAPGHDARYKSALRNTHKAETQSTDVFWVDGWIPVEEAVSRIAAAIGSDWAAVPSGGSPRSLTTTKPQPIRSKPSVTPPSPGEMPSIVRPRPSRPSRALRASRVTELMNRLDQRGPVTGNWGWYRPVADPDRRFPARVQRTNRDNGDLTLDLYVRYDECSSEVVLGVSYDNFFADGMAKP